jgi:tetratricopeptide (TPR) repeat protein/serine/threonine protein kinase
MTEREIFLAALDLADPTARAAYLDAACCGDANRRERIDALLRSHVEAGSFLSRPALAAAEPDATAAYTSVALGTVETATTGTFSPDADHRESMTTGAHHPDGATDSFGDAPTGRERRPGIAVGRVIADRYTLVELIGEGGMGSVYLASQNEPVKRQVALKLIKSGMDSKAVLARFDAERQALARMDHPNIARIYDGGVTASGRPYFVMELVKGVPLTEYCDAHRLSVAARLELFVSVCQAVQHAHQKGIIHRDLKPGNVLVTEVDGRPTPKVIDFGVAKATEQKLTEISFSDTGAIVGTPAYMSPEQADPSSMDIDTRTDVYSLGVMLYELLTGSPPIDASRFKRGAVLEMLRMVREEDPRRPSTKLSTAAALANIATNRNIEPAKLARLLKGELDWVVMKALEKDRTRRYDTANGLARDIQRYLADEVVEARPPSAGYRLKKFVRRNPLQLALAVAVVLLLLGGVSVAWWQAEQSGARRETDVRRQLEDEQRASRTAEAVKILLGECEKALTAGNPKQAEVALAAAVKRSAEGGADTETDRIERLTADLTLLRDLEAVDQFRWTWSENRFPDPAVAAARTREILKRFGADPDTVSVDDAAARVSASVVRERIIPALDRLLRQQRTAGVRRLLRQVDANPYRDAVRDAVLADDASRLVALTGKEDEAREQPPGFATFLGENKAIAVEQQRELLRAAVMRWPGELNLLMALGNTYRGNQKWADDRLRWYQAAVAVAPANSAAHNNLGLALRDKGQLDAAISCFKTASELDSKNAAAQFNLGIALADKGQLDAAIARYKTAIELDPKNAKAHTHLGNALYGNTQLDAAIASYKQAIELDPNEAKPHNNLGNALYGKGQVAAAIASYKRAIELDPNEAKAHNNLGNALHGKGEVDAAIACYKRAIELDPNNPRVHYNLGKALYGKGQVDAAIISYKRATELDPKNATAHHNLGLALYGKGQVDAAIISYKTAIELDPVQATAHYNLGKALYGKGQLDAAIACYKRAIELDPMEAMAHINLGLALAGKGLVDAAIISYKRAIELDPKNAMAHINLGLALAGKGQVDAAIISYKRAIELDPKDARVHYNLALALAGKGQMEAAIASFKLAIELDPMEAKAHNNLGLALYGKGQVDTAIGCFKRAIELDPKSATAHHNLGLALAGKGQVDAAIACFKQAIVLDPKNAMAHCNLGHSLATRGQFAESLAAHKRGHELGTKLPGWRYPSAEWVRQAEAKAELEAKLPAFLKGEFQPGDNPERLGLAGVCHAKGFHHAAVGLYGAVFSADPKLANWLPAQPRYNAACSAALAAAGQGEDAAKLDDAAKAKLRGQALNWLTADLAALTRLFDSGPPQARSFIVQTLNHWQKDADLAGIRDAAGLAKLSADERKAWSQLWSNAAALLQRAETAATNATAQPPLRAKGPLAPLSAAPPPREKK